MSTAIPLQESRGERPAGGLLGLAERGWLPDAWIRAGIRSLCSERLRQERRGGLAAQSVRYGQLLAALRHGPLAIETEAANAQHYELPTEFFQLCLGRRLKYSACYFPPGVQSLDAAEEAMLRLYEARAELADGQSILELGCGWGSLTLWMAERYPRARITAVSNSRSQGAYIREQCQSRGLGNVRVITADINTLALDAESFDRCVSVEMFEHVRNHERLLARIAAWLRPGGRLFVHIFAHHTAMYAFETTGRDDWMARHFFTGGLMPAADTLLWFQRDLSLEARWLLEGTHYERTANAWLERQDLHREPVLRVLAAIHGRAGALLWQQRWRMFWMACAELFGYGGGTQWLVAHYRFARGD